jgi:hypothetical protein
MVDKPNSASMNTTEILLFLNKTLFADEPNKVSNNNQLLRLYTFLDSRAATELGSKIKQLPNIQRIQEKAETVINKFRAAKTEGAIKAFNMFVDEIQDPATRSAKYTKQFADLTKSFNDFVGELAKNMETMLPLSLGDTKIRPYLDELKKHDRFKELSSVTTTLEKDGSRLREEFDKLGNKAKITLDAVAPEISLAEKNKAAQKPAEGPTNPAND